MSEKKVLVLFFMGQGGYLFSMGIPVMARKVASLSPRVITKVYRYVDFDPAAKDIQNFRKLGYKIVLVGYSLGNTTTTLLQETYDVDTLIAIAESQLAGQNNHRIEHKHTKRSILFYSNADALSSAGLNSGFDIEIKTGYTHLLFPWATTVVNRVIEEVRKLL